MRASLVFQLSNLLATLLAATRQASQGSAWDPMVAGACSHSTSQMLCIPCCPQSSANAEERAAALSHGALLRPPSFKRSESQLKQRLHASPELGLRYPEACCTGLLCTGQACRGGMQRARLDARPGNVQHSR